MGWQAIEACKKHSQQSGSAYLLLLVIASLVNDNTGEYAITIGDLKRDAHMSQTQVYLQLAKLREAGDITITKKGRRACPIYRVACYSGFRENGGVEIPESGKSYSRNPESIFPDSGTPNPISQNHLEETQRGSPHDVRLSVQGPFASNGRGKTRGYPTAANGKGQKKPWDRDQGFPDTWDEITWGPRGGPR